MTRRHHFHDFPSATGDPVYRVSFDCHSAAERDAVRAAGLAVVAPAAFVPALSSGPAFDSPEDVPMAGGSVGNAPLTYAGVPIVTNPRTDEPGDTAYMVALPPNCEGFNCIGDVLAHAQHEAATDGDECSSGVCLMTRGSD
jgi:hypothetical protein